MPVTQYSGRLRGKRTISFSRAWAIQQHCKTVSKYKIKQGLGMDVAQCEGPEFNPQSCQKERELTEKIQMFLNL